MLVAFLALMDLNHLKSNWHLAASFLLSFSPFKNSQIELASSCQLSVANLEECANLYLAAVCRFPFYLNCLKSLDSNWYLAASASCQFIIVRDFITGCHWPVAYKPLIVLNHFNRIGIWLQLPVANPLERANWHLAVI